MDGDKRIDIGSGVTIQFWTDGATGERGGLVEDHADLRDPSKSCSGSLTFDTPAGRRHAGPYWTVESWEPLTLSPSVLCTVCGHHGFIRNGRWEGS